LEAGWREAAGSRRPEASILLGANATKRKDFIFTIKGDKPVTNEASCKAFRRGIKQIETENEGWEANPAWTPYWLRHSFGTYQMENLDDAEIAKLMGNGVVVLRKDYQHPDDETLYLSTNSQEERNTKFPY
jgi:site-specific recombinase XerD